MRPFCLVSLAAFLATVGLALLLRHRFFAIFSGVVLGIHTLSTVLLAPTLSPTACREVVLWYAHLATTSTFTLRALEHRRSHKCVVSGVFWLLPLRSSPAWASRRRSAPPEAVGALRDRRLGFCIDFTLR